MMKLACLGGALICLLAACAPPESAPPRPSSRHDAIAGGANDPEDLNGRLTVQVNQVHTYYNQNYLHGSGQLISPLLVLTAQHVALSTGPAPEVLLSDTRLPTSASKPPTARKLAPISALNPPPDDLSLDFGLVYLDPTALDGDPAAWKLILESNIFRPSLQVPPATVAAGDYTFTVPVAFAGWANPDQRKAASASGFTQVMTASGSHWRLAGPPGSQEGDSGGPLFVTRSDGARDVFGLISASNNQQQTFFADLTNAQTKAWLLSKVIDKPSQHTARWNAKHPPRAGYSDRWLGETDYSGPCQVADDADCDHWFTAHDNCPGVFNPNQRDADDDGFGDECPCPCDPAAGFQDYDGDGVCEVACPQQRADNCPKVPNPTQANCNSDAERARGAIVLGDVCDPVPCPAVSAPLIGTKGPGCQGDPQIGQSCAGRSIANRLDIVGLASSNRLGDLRDDNPFDSVNDIVSVPVPAISTQVRFCQSNVPLGFDCHADAAISDPFLLGPETLWHSVTLGAAVCGGSGCSVTDDPPGQSYGVDYDSKTLKALGWDYLADNARWGALIPPPGSYPECSTTSVSGTCLDGTLWFHASTLVGDTISKLGNQTVGTHGPGLANHYMDLRPDAAFSYSLSGKGLVQRFAFPWRALPDPSPERDFGVRVMVVSGVDLAVLHPGGATYTSPAGGPSTQVSSAARLLLQQHPTARFLSSADPDGAIGGLDVRIQAALLDTTQSDDVAGVLLNDQGVLRTADELGLPMFSRSATGPRPAPRLGAHTFLSKSSGGLFMLGGDTLAGAPLHDVWFRRFGGDWRQVTGSYRPDALLAATYSFSDHRLWILDHTQTGTVDVARLARIDPLTGVAQTMAICPRGQVFGGHFLSIDADGAVLLTSTHPTGSRVAKLGIDANGIAVLAKVDDSNGVLSEPPLVDATSYTLVSSTAAGGLQLQVKAQLAWDAAGTRGVCEAF